MIMRAGRGRKATVRRKARRRRSKKTEEGDKHLRWGRRRNSLTDNFTLAVYMRFLVAADTRWNYPLPGGTRPSRDQLSEAFHNWSKTTGTPDTATLPNSPLIN